VVQEKEVWSMARVKTALMGFLPSIIVAQSSVFCSKREKALDDKIFDVSNRLKIGLVENEKKCRARNKDGVQICHLANIRYGWKGYPLVRIANARIKAPIEEVSSCWFNQGARKKWDIGFCDESQLLKEYDSETALAYIKGKTRYLFPSRDFAFHVCRVPGGLVGIQDYLAVAFINTDAAQDVPATSWSVRGNMNSILLLQPVNAQVTDVTYIVEYAVNGWVPSFLAEFVADNAANTLLQLKKDLEEEESSEQGVSIEEAARMRFRKHQMQKEENKSATIVNDVTSSRADLEKTVAILEAKLLDIQKTRRNEGLDLADLENRVKSDIQRIRERIKQM
jgi:hypothetical protein